MYWLLSIQIPVLMVKQSKRVLHCKATSIKSLLHILFVIYALKDCVLKTCKCTEKMKVIKTIVLQCFR